MNHASTVRLSWLVLLVSLAVSGCVPSEAGPTTAELEAVRDTVLELEEAMNSDIDALDCDAGLARVGDREPIFVANGNVVRTADELRQACEEMVAGREGAHFEIDERTANALSLDAAFVVREGDYTIDRADGTSLTIRLVMTTMWHRDDDGWTMVHLHESVPPLDVEGSGGDE
jgi:ketosteroid isomerase-like protein